MNKGQQWKLVGIIALTAACIWIIMPPFTVKDKDGAILCSAFFVKVTLLK